MCLLTTMPEVIWDSYRLENNGKSRIFEGHGTIFRDFRLLKGNTRHNVLILISFLNLRIIHHSVPLFSPICTVTSHLMFNTWGISLYALSFRKSIKLVLVIRFQGNSLRYIPLV